MPTPAASSRRTASAIAPRAPAHRDAHDRRPRTSAARRPSRPARRSPRRGRRRPRACTSRRSPPTRSLSSSDGALGDHVAVVDHDDLVREPVGLLEVLRGQQHGRALGDARLDRLPHAEAGARVEPGGRLVEEDHRRAEDERGGEVQPPAHAARVRLGGPLARLGELEALEQLVRAPARLGARQVVELADHLEVLEAGQVLVDRGVLAGEADLGAQGVGVAHDVEARDARAAAVGLQQRGQDAYRGGLAGAVGTEQAEDRAGLARRSSTPHSAWTAP